MTVDRVDSCGSAGEEYGRCEDAGEGAATARNGLRGIRARLGWRDIEAANRGAARLAAGPVSDIVGAQGIN